MKIFWSWQSDTPGKTGRHLIREALDEAIDELRQAPDFEEPLERDVRESIHIDQDIQGVTGSPDLFQEIRRKISASQVFIADVTSVGQQSCVETGSEDAKPPKKLINSNVAIELGYALHAVSDTKVILVFNEHYGNHLDLPFDLRHKGGAVVFNLPPSAPNETIKTEKGKLRGRIKEKLRPLIAPEERKSAIIETPSTFSKACYFNQEEILAEFGDWVRLKYYYPSGALSYLRIIPTLELAQPISRSSLRLASYKSPVLSDRHGSVTGVNSYGSITLQPGPHPKNGGKTEISSSTQLFRNGEVWSLCSTMLIKTPEGRPPGLKYPFLPYLMFEQAYYDALYSLMKFTEANLGLCFPCNVEFGLPGMAGAYLAYSLRNPFQSEQPGPIQNNDLIFRGTANNGGSVALNQALLGFFEEVFDSTGYSRPKNLFNFPPDRPQQN